MRNTRQRDTPFEIRVRRLLHARGLRYRVDRAIPAVTRARPDVVFGRERVAVFLDGCFWHSCPQHATTPTANRDWWRAKLLANVERDRRHDRELTAAGWTVCRFWEHQDATFVATEIEQLVLRRRRAGR
ncbi:MAG: very short patch repair endonuclease [bacterium]|nr:very short patch repair endonuclease [bacterium]